MTNATANREPSEDAGKVRILDAGGGEIAPPEPHNSNTRPNQDPVLPRAVDAARTHRGAYDGLAIDGRLSRENVQLLFEPVHDLLRGRATTFFCTPAFCVERSPIITGYRAFQHAGGADLPYIDRAMLAHALKFSRRLAQAGVYVAAGASVSFETLISTEGRKLYQEALRAAGAPDDASLVLIASNLPSGITASRIAELVGSLRPFAKRVFAHLPNVDSSLSNCGQLGAGGFVLSMPRAARLQPDRMAAWLARFSESQLALSCIDQIGNENELDAVRRASIRFGMGPVFGPVWFRGDSPPIEVESFMRAAQRAARSENRNVYRLSAHRELRLARDDMQ